MAMPCDFSNFEEPAARFFVVVLHVAETLLGFLFTVSIAFELQHALPHDYFEATPFVPGSHEAAVQPNAQRTIGNGQSLPILFASLHQRGALLAQFSLHPVRQPGTGVGAWSP